MDAARRYTIYGKIASGGMASVHFGRLHGGEGFARTVAIKQLHPHLAEDPAFAVTLVDEARMAARIHHPNVVSTLDVVSDRGEIFVVMEYVYGESLARLLKIGSESGLIHVPLPITVAIAVGALHGLHAAHEAKSGDGAPLGIVHRDVSPQNLLVGTDGLTRVIDFGVAKAAGRLQITREGTIKGKRPYMAPEQITGDAVSPRTDVYALGVVLWEMLTARRLFQSDNDGALVASILAGVKAAPGECASDVPAQLDALVMKALARDPADRFGSALEMAQALVSVVTPAMTIDVGRWVEESAHEALAARSARLADIESGAHTSTVALEADDPRRESATLPLTSQSSSFSVDLSRPNAPRRVSGRTLAGVLAAGALLACTLWVRGMVGNRPSIGPVAKTAPSVALGAPPALLDELASEAGTASLSDSAPPKATAAPLPQHARGSPPSARPASRPAPAPPRSRTPSSHLEPDCSIVTTYDQDGQPHFQNVCP